MKAYVTLKLTLNTLGAYVYQANLPMGLTFHSFCRFLTALGTKFGSTYTPEVMKIFIHVPLLYLRIKTDLRAWAVGGFEA